MESLSLAQGANIHYTPELYCEAETQCHETGRILSVLSCFLKKEVALPFTLLPVVLRERGNKKKEK